MTLGALSGSVPCPGRGILSVANAPRLTVSLISTDLRLQAAFWRWVAPYPVRPLCFTSAAALLAEPQAVQSPLLLLSLRLPDMTAPELIAELLLANRNRIILCLDDEENIASAVKAMRAGALDVVDPARAEVVLLSHLQRILGTAAPHALL
jgi:two-component system response regulator FixJ